MSHQKPAHLDQDGIAGSVAVRVVVLLEVIYVDIDAPPFRLLIPRGRVHGREIPAVVTSCEWITDALLDELCLQVLPAGDVHQDSVKDRLAGIGVRVAVPRVEHRAHAAVGAGDLKLSVPNRSGALDQPHFFLSDVSVHEVADPVALQLLEGCNTENLEERRVGVEDVAVFSGDIDAFTQVLGEPGKRLRIAETSETRIVGGWRLVAQRIGSWIPACALPCEA